ncbi:MAG TPA: putative metal-dependent hydrolase [Candidatus Acidoferrales bacterium]
MTSDPRYPIGKFNSPASVSESDRKLYIDEIEAAPAKLRAAIAGLTPSQFSTPYREGGWTVKQLVHHVPDSHMNAYVRFKLGLTEDEPTIKTYEEALWAKLPDSETVPVETSLVLLDSLHKRWVVLLRSIPASGWSRKIRHPEWGTMALDQVLAQYAWHGKHHVAHITSLRDRNGWK